VCGNQEKIGVLKFQRETIMFPQILFVYFWNPS